MNEELRWNHENGGNKYQKLLSLEEYPLVCPQFDPLFYCFVPCFVWFRPIRRKCLAPGDDGDVAMEFLSRNRKEETESQVRGAFEKLEQAEQQLW